MLALARAGRLEHLALDETHLAATTDYVAAVIRERYPDLRIPYHSRWRHFAAGGIDRCAGLDTRARIGLCVVSVLLDAGAGPHWRFREPATGLAFGRSEGLAVASVHAFRDGLFHDPAAMTDAALARAFQSDAANPLAGLPGRAALLRRLGAVLRERGAADIAALFDPLRIAGPVAARDVLIRVLDVLAPIWPRPLGDVWPHPALGLVPFHKLSQWLSYSLIEALEADGIAVTGIEALTGLAEYRNGGLFLDLGVLRLRDPGLASRPLPVAHPAVVEWRALTVALLDSLVPLVGARLGTALPLACLLEGGTWEAGRRLAAERRAGGAPPLVVESGGAVF